MTKVAKLPDGQMLGFEDDVPDEDMHNEVKRHMGVPIVPTAKDRAQQASLESDAQRNMALGGLAQTMAQLTNVVGNLCREQQTTQQMLMQVASAVGALNASVNKSADRLYQAMTATITQDIERDDKGKITQTTITKEI